MTNSKSTSAAGSYSEHLANIAGQSHSYFASWPPELLAAARQAGAFRSPVQPLAEPGVYESEARGGPADRSDEALKPFSSRLYAEGL